MIYSFISLFIPIFSREEEKQKKKMGWHFHEEMSAYFELFIPKDPKQWKKGINKWQNKIIIHMYLIEIGNGCGKGR